MDHSLLRGHIRELRSRMNNIQKEPKMCSKCKFFPEAPVPESNYRKSYDPQPLCEFCRADPDLPDVQKLGVRKG